MPKYDIITAGTVIQLDRNIKPKKTADELVNKLQNEKGITFNIIDKNTAVDYFRDINNYLRTASYRKNYEKHRSGEDKGKYIKLDFAYLTELSSIDIHLRKVAFHMCVDIEHAIKTKLITTIENNPDENGYDIVDLFFQKFPDVLDSIEGKADSIFTGGLIDKYFSLCYVFDKSQTPTFLKTRISRYDCPVWVLVEIISFGDLLKLVSLYNEQYPLYKVNVPSNSILKAVKSLRNACAHNNCLLNNMNVGTTKPSAEITQFVAKIKTIGKEERNKKLSCRPMFELVCMLKAYDEVVSKNVKKHGFDSISEFVDNILLNHEDYFDTNIVVKTSFDFFKKVVDNFK